MSSDQNPQGLYPPPQWESHPPRGAYPPPPGGYGVSPMNATSPMNTSLILLAGSTHFTRLPTSDGNTARHGYLTAPSATTSRPLPPPCARHVSRTRSRPVPRWPTAAHEFQPASTEATHGDSMPLLPQAQGEPPASWRYGQHPLTDVN